MGILFSGLTFDEMYYMLSFAKVELKGCAPSTVESVTNCIGFFDDSTPTLLHIFWIFGEFLATGINFQIDPRQPEALLIDKLLPFGLVMPPEYWSDYAQPSYGTLNMGYQPPKPNKATYKLSDDGRHFFLRLAFSRLNVRPEDRRGHDPGSNNENT